MDILYQNLWFQVQKILNQKHRHEKRKGENVSKSNENQTSFGELLNIEIQKYKQNSK